MGQKYVYFIKNPPNEILNKIEKLHTSIQSSLQKIFKNF